MQKVKYHGFDFKLSDLKGSEVTNNLDPDLEEHKLYGFLYEISNGKKQSVNAPDKHR